MGSAISKIKLWPVVFISAHIKSHGMPFGWSEFYNEFTNSFYSFYLFLLDVGNFTNHLDVVLTIDLGKPFSIKCPAHAPNYGASYKWLSSDHLSLKPDSYRAISPSSGELSFMYVTQDDVHEIGELNGIGCAIFGANYVYVSGIYMLKARLPGKKKKKECYLEYVLKKRALSRTWHS